MQTSIFFSALLHKFNLIYLKFSLFMVFLCCFSFFFFNLCQHLHNCQEYKLIKFVECILECFLKNLISGTTFCQNDKTNAQTYIHKNAHCSVIYNAKQLEYSIGNRLKKSWYCHIIEYSVAFTNYKRTKSFQWKYIYDIHFLSKNR